MGRVIPVAFALIGIVCLPLLPLHGAEGPRDHSCTLSRAEEPQSAAAAETEKRILLKMNRIREIYGFGILARDPRLNQVARCHSCAMAEGKRFSHQGETGSTPAERIEGAGIRFSRVGENIAMFSHVSGVADEAVDAWMKSRPHRENILDRRFTETGIGLWTLGSEVYITQVFLRP